MHTRRNSKPPPPPTSRPTTPEEREPAPTRPTTPLVVNIPASSSTQVPTINITIPPEQQELTYRRLRYIYGLLEDLERELYLNPVMDKVLHQDVQLLRQESYLLQRNLTLADYYHTIRTLPRPTNFTAHTPTS